MGQRDASQKREALKGTDLNTAHNVHKDVVFRLRLTSDVQLLHLQPRAMPPSEVAPSPWEIYVHREGECDWEGGRVAVYDTTPKLEKKLAGVFKDEGSA